MGQGGVGRLFDSRSQKGTGTMPPHPLSEQPHHTPATVVAVEGDRAFRRRLMEMGLLPGATVSITNVAPMGDPIELLVRRSRISIRKNEARSVLVE
ncbi:MAG: ferrous iron transport protein A [Myxococcota bacterium]|jgi:ferrous iron transport protein A